MPKLSYAAVGDNYDTKDPIKKLAQESARLTGSNLKKGGFQEIADSRGESAYVWKQGTVHMATTIEGLGTKNLVADAMRKTTGKTYYDTIGYDTVATIINDLISVGAKPLAVHAYWAVEDNSWLADEMRMKDLIRGWKKACDDAGAAWGGGETPTMKNIVVPGTCELGGSAVGIIKKTNQLIIDKKLKPGDRIILLKSTGVNANGLSLVRAIAQKLPNGFATKMPSGTMFGEAVLAPTNIYAQLIQNLFKAKINLHYISNITGHGLRKVMRARGQFTYTIEKLFPPNELFSFMQQSAKLSDEEMYQTFNMGQDYALFMPKKDCAAALKIIKKNGFVGLDAGFVSKGPKQIILQEKNIIFNGDTLDLR